MSEQQPSGYPPGPGHGPGYGPGHGPGHGQPEMSPADQRLWGMLAHLSGLVSALVALSFIGPLVVYLVVEDRGVFVRHQAAEALDFQLLVWAVLLASGAATALTLGLAVLVLGPLLAVAGLVALALIIVAAVQADRGVDHRYPLNWRLVR